MPYINYEKKKDHIAIITLNRPEKLNALNPEMMNALCETWIKYRDDVDAWIAILTGSGKAFTCGADKSWIELSAQGQKGPNLFLKTTLRDPYWSGRLEKPVITAINGLTVGAGVDLLLRSDLRVACESAWFKQAEVERGNIMIFYDNLPCAIAAEMISGFKISAQRAYEVGMINRIVPENKLMDTAMEMAEELLTRVPLVLLNALKILRDIKNSSAVIPRRMLDHYTTLLSSDLLDSEDVREASSAFLEKENLSLKKDNI